MANTVLAVEALEAKRLGESKGALKRSGMYVVGKNRKRGKYSSNTFILARKLNETAPCDLDFSKPQSAVFDKYLEK